MFIESLVEPLRRVALFQGLQPTQLSEIARQAERVQFKADDTIISEGQPADAAILIVSGTAKRTGGPSTGDDTFGPGILLGEMAMLVETEYSSTVVCVEPIRALKITRERLLEQMSTDISLADHFVAQLSGRLRQLAAEFRKISKALEPEGRPKHRVPGPALLAFEPPPQQTAIH